MPDVSLLQPLFDGPLDIVGDVHGEIEALLSLLRHLGHDGRGHTAGRRLLFLGDLVDRGPDSPAVVRYVAELLDRGHAQCLLGNHELNLLLGLRKEGNAWFFGEPDEPLGRPARAVPQTAADEQARQDALALFRRLPLALERPDLRAVHACWHPEAIEEVRGRADPVRTFREFRQAIEDDLRARPAADDTERKLALQNRNPVKVLTSGPERRLQQAGWAGGKWRYEGRVPWWETAGLEQSFCVFGHYWRVPLPPDEPDFMHLFDDGRPYAALGQGGTTCLDYSVGKRHRERLDGVEPGAYRTRLAALRWPEQVLVFDDGTSVPLG